MKTSDPKRTAVVRPPQSYESWAPAPGIPATVLDDWLCNCRITPTRAAEWLCTPAWHQEPRQFAWSFYYWVEAGAGWFRLGEGPRPCRIREGELLLVPAQTVHEVWTEPGATLTVHTAHFGARVYGTVDLPGLLGMAGAFPASPAAPYARVSEMLAREFAVQAPGWRAAMEAGIRELLLYVLRAHAGRLRPGPVRARQRDLLRLQPAIEELDRRLADPDLRVADLARTVSMSEVYLRKLYRAAVGLSPVHFVRQRRIERACELLRGGDRPIKAIAEACGFSDLPFFYRTFRRLMGQTPSLYRQAAET